MAANTSCRLSGNGYDSATEDSISMYYSFNTTEHDKTLENSELDSTVELAAIDSALNTIIKAPKMTPIKGKFSKCLQLNCGSSSTPSDGKNSLHTLIETKVEEDTSLLEQRNDFEINVQTIETWEKREVAIITGGQNNSQMEIIAISDDNSVEIIENSVTSDTDAVLKDANAKIWPIDNRMDHGIDIKSEGDKIAESGKEDDTTAKENSVEADHSLADKMVEEIRCLLQGTKVNIKDKENVEKDDDIKYSSDKDNVLKSSGKKQSNLKKPSRLSVSVARRSILQTDSLLSAKTVTPITRIVQKPRKSVSNLSSGIPTARELSNSTSYSSLKSTSAETVKSASSRRSFLPGKRMSILVESKSSLGSIPEDSKKTETDKALRNKRFSVINAKPKTETSKTMFKMRAIPKTTLNSPVMVRKELMRKSINKFASNSSSTLSRNKNGASTKQTSIIPESKSEISLAKSACSAVKLTKLPSKPQISREDFVCEVCLRSFRVSSIFEAHKKTHNAAVMKETKTCKFCDKSFAIAKALDKHLLENCLKIPLAERKKINVAVSQVNEDSAKRSGTTIRTRGERMSTLPSVGGRNRMSMAGNLMPPPSTTKIMRAPMAHSGISKTPNKTVHCRPCEKTFDNVLSFAEHVLSHSNSSLGEE